MPNLEPGIACHGSPQPPGRRCAMLNEYRLHMRHMHACMHSASFLFQKDIVLQVPVLSSCDGTLLLRTFVKKCLKAPQGACCAVLKETHLPVISRFWVAVVTSLLRAKWDLVASCRAGNELPSLSLPVPLASVSDHARPSVPLRFVRRPSAVPGARGTSPLLGTGGQAAATAALMHKINCNEMVIASIIQVRARTSGPAAWQWCAALGPLCTLRHPAVYQCH